MKILKHAEISASTQQKTWSWCFCPCSEVYLQLCFHWCRAAALQAVMKPTVLETRRQRNWKHSLKASASCVNDGEKKAHDTKFRCTQSKNYIFTVCRTTKSRMPRRLKQGFHFLKIQQISAVSSNNLQTDRKTAEMVKSRTTMQNYILQLKDIQKNYKSQLS